MADASYFPYQTGVPVKLVPLGDGTYASAVAIEASGGGALGSVVVTSMPPVTGTVAVSSVTTLPQGVYEVSQNPNNLSVTPTTYAANQVMSGVLTFPLILTANSQYGGILESITVKFKTSVQTVAMNVAIFTQAPTGTFTNGNTAAIAKADSQYLLGVYQLTATSSVLGSHTIYNLDGIAKALVGITTSLFVVVVPSGTTVALGATAADDMIVTLGILGG